MYQTIVLKAKATAFLYSAILLGLVSEKSAEFFRIAGGHEAALGELPMMVAIVDQKTDRHYCGAFLIADEFVLTVAHCVDCYRNDCYSNYRLIVGDRIIDEGEQQLASSRQVFRIKRVHLHPGYDKLTMAHDIALIRLSGSVLISKNANTIALCHARPPIGKACTTAGWGTINRLRWNFSNVLLATEVLIQKNTACGHLRDFRKQTMICVGDMFGMKGSCDGDSGGPLICDGVAVAIVSFGTSCALPGIGKAYTDIATHLRWIHDEMKQMTDAKIMRSKKIWKGGIGGGASKNWLILFWYFLPAVVEIEFLTAFSQIIVFFYSSQDLK